jgi:hypothetical protein
MSDHRRSDFPARNGAVMTDEVGVITGEVTLVTEIDEAGAVTQRVQYKDADEWYALTGAPAALAPGEDLDALHARTLAALSV